MKSLLVAILALSFGILITSEVFGEKTAFVDTVKFIQYLDENTALEEVRNGNLDIYYYKISSDRLENIESREGLQVFDSTGGSYSILINPAESNKFNPFSEKEARFALNYLIDRKLIVNELMGGYGAPMISYYSP
ncbi:MAG: ABC transporter substrate-binding protein, partial [Nitrosopumilus sp.]|nr:ABC transporter substrate-binding protein [Nitrosopumilus sp.]